MVSRLDGGRDGRVHRVGSRNIEPRAPHKDSWQHSVKDSKVAFAPPVKLRIGKLISHNLKINGLKAILFSVGLGKTEFVEFSRAISLIEQEGNGLVLDVGCGHSLLSSLAKIEVLVLDLDVESLKWQLKISGRKNQAIRASATNLPFREEVFRVVTAISSLEHIPMDGDKAACREILRSMRSGGLSIISVPGLPSDGSPVKIKTGLMSGIPIWAQYFLKGTILRTIFAVFQVDRSKYYMERIYSAEDVKSRLVPYGCITAQANAYALPKRIREIISKVYPYGFLTPIDIILASQFRAVGDMLTSQNVRGNLVMINFRKS